MALAFAALGRSEKTAVVPSALAGAFLLPLVTFFLARRLGVARLFAFGAAVTVLGTPLVAEHSVRCMADLPVAVLTTLGVALALKRSNWTAVVSGGIIGLAFYIKPSALVMAVAVLVAVVVTRRMSRRSLAIWVGLWLLSFAVVVAPWFVRNIAVFGDMTYSVHRHWSAVYDFDPDFYAEGKKWRVWWAHPGGAPTRFEAISLFGFRRIAKVMAQRFTRVFLTEGAYIFTGWLALGAAFVAVGRKTWTQKVGFLLAVTLAYAVLLSLLNPAVDRLLFPLLPCVVAVIWLGLSNLAPVAFQPKWWLGHLRQRLEGFWIRPGRQNIVMLICALLMLRPAVELVARNEAVDPRRRHIKQAGIWARDNLDSDAHVMHIDPRYFHYYARLETVVSPVDTPPIVEDVVRFYGVDHILIPDRQRTDSERLAGTPFALKLRSIRAYLDSYEEHWTRTAVPAIGSVLYTRKPPDRARRPSPADAQQSPAHQAGAHRTAGELHRPQTRASGPEHAAGGIASFQHTRRPSHEPQTAIPQRPGRRDG